MKTIELSTSNKDADTLYNWLLDMFEHHENKAMKKVHVTIHYNQKPW